MSMTPYWAFSQADARLAYVMLGCSIVNFAVMVWAIYRIYRDESEGR